MTDPDRITDRPPVWVQTRRREWSDRTEPAELLDLETPECVTHWDSRCWNEGTP